MSLLEQNKTKRGCNHHLVLLLMTSLSTNLAKRQDLNLTCPAAQQTLCLTSLWVMPQRCKFIGNTLCWFTRQNQADSAAELLQCPFHSELHFPTSACVKKRWYHPEETLAFPPDPSHLLPGHGLQEHLHPPSQLWLLSIVALTHCPCPVEKGRQKTARCCSPLLFPCKKMDLRDVTDKLQEGMLMDIATSVKALKELKCFLWLSIFLFVFASVWIASEFLFFLAVLLNKPAFSKLEKFIIRSFWISWCFSHLTYQARAVFLKPCATPLKFPWATNITHVYWIPWAFNNKQLWWITKVKCT